FFNQQLTLDERVRTPNWRLAYQQSFSGGVSAATRIFGRLGVQTGAQFTRNSYLGTSRHVRFIEEETETNDGSTLTSTFTLDTELAAGGQGGGIPEVIDVERSIDTPLPDNNRIVIRIEDEFKLRVWTVPVQLSYRALKRGRLSLDLLAGGQADFLQRTKTRQQITVQRAGFEVRERDPSRRNARVREKTLFSWTAASQVSYQFSDRWSVMARYQRVWQDDKLLNRLAGSGHNVALGVLCRF
ncbi:MAG: hypothetical protein AAF840_18450, partial [Bacteroidota bacterium]